MGTGEPEGEEKVYGKDPAHQLSRVKGPGQDVAVARSCGAGRSFCLALVSLNSASA